MEQSNKPRPDSYNEWIAEMKKSGVHVGGLYDDSKNYWLHKKMEVESPGPDRELVTAAIGGAFLKLVNWVFSPFFSTREKK